MVSYTSDTKRFHEKCNASQFNPLRLQRLVTNMSAQEQLSFKALADPTRREILFLLAKNEMTIADVADNFQMTRAAVKKHLSILREGDLIRVRAAGRTKLNSLNPDGMKRVTDWIRYFDAFWDTRLNALKSEIEKELK